MPALGLQLADEAPALGGDQGLGADRREGGQTAPPEGLTLTEVRYPDGLCPV